MTRSKLVDAMASLNPHLRPKDISKIIDIFFDHIVDSVSNNQRVEFRGFGMFTARQRRARKGRNPRNGQPVSVEAKFVPFFKTGSALHDKLNENLQPRSPNGPPHGTPTVPPHGSPNGTPHTPLNS